MCTGPVGTSASIKMLIAVFTQLRLKAAITFEYTVIQSELCVGPATTAALLTAGEPSINDNQLSPVPGSFLFRLTSKPMKANVTDSLGQVVVFDRTGGVQILDRNERPRFRQFACGLMQNIFPDKIGRASCRERV